jgi:hypothetical protein
VIRVSTRPVVDPVTIQRVLGQVNRVVDRKAVVAGESMVRAVRRIVQADFQRGDPSHRKPGPHLENSFTYETQRVNANKVEVRLVIRRGVDPKKIAALEHGAKQPYTITPGKVKRSHHKALSVGLQFSPASVLHWPDPAGGPAHFATVVHRDPFPGRHMMERARDEIFDRLRDGRL